MSIQIIKQRELVEEITYRLFFQRVNDYPNCGFSFPCDEKGNVLIENMYPEAVENYKALTASPNPKYEEPYVRKEVHRHRTNAEAICECGKTIELWDEYLGASECPHCHTWHNMFGQTVSNPNNWDLDY